MTNKQLNLVKEIIQDRIKESQKEIKEENNFDELVQQIIEDHPASTILSNVEDLGKRISELKKEKRQLITDAGESVEGARFRGSPNRIKQQLESNAKDKACEEIGIENISGRDIEKQIMLNKNKDLNELVESVTESLL